ncbi:MAG TPA: hypothetical protein VLA89_13655 [Gemmatimonadales bacterium]|nr:hypothetical protein [Gemmatimonadales bacterium]
MQWFRLYNDVLDDPKVQSLTPYQFKCWINLLCLASKSKVRGSLPDKASIAFRLRLSLADTEAILSDLATAGFINYEQGAISIHDWNEWQFDSDSSTQRTQKYRSKQRETSRERHSDALDTDTDTDTDTEQKRGAAKRGQRLPDDFVIADEMWSWADKQGFDHDWVVRETERFADYWWAVPGQRGVKLDWAATWRNWLRRAADDRPKLTVVPAKSWRPKTPDQELAELQGREPEAGSFQHELWSFEVNKLRRDLGLAVVDV